MLRLGVRGRLYAAFFGISLCVVVAAGVSLFSFFRVDRALRGITEGSVPVAIASLELARQAEGIVGAAPVLLSAPSLQVHEELSRRSNADFDRLDALLQEISKQDVEPQAIASISRSVDQLRETNEALKRVVAARLVVAEQKTNQVVETHALGEQIDRILALRAANQARRIVRPRAAAGHADAGAPDKRHDIEIIEMQSQQHRLQSGRNDLSLLMSGLSAMTLADAADALAQPLQRAQASLEVLRALVPLIDPAQRPSMSEGLDRLETLLTGNQGIAPTRLVELQMIAAGEKSLQENAALSQRFAQAVDRLVGAAKSNIVAANSEVVSTQSITTWILLLVVTLALTGSFLIALLYVRRNVIARLTGLSASMTAIADGNLDIALPSPGDDEIGQMAQALSVFRDTAIVVKATNLREVKEARRRLDDAIESTQEGFALFDRDDRLLLRNSRYGELLYDGVDVPQPGAPYETILRRAVERGLILGLNADTESWIQQRLDQHRCEGRLAEQQQRAAGRWIRITEHKTEDGGTVAVYSDITEIKKHERDLDELVDKLKTASEAKSSFLANVSHELRTPLTAILGFARIIQKRLESVVVPALDSNEPRTERAVEQIRGNLRIMLLEGERLTKMVNNVLDLEKIEAGQMAWNIAPLDIAELLGEASEATSSLYQPKGLDFHVEVAPDLPMVLGDRDRVLQVILNLISNAVKFTEHGGVTCRAECDGGDEVSISVSDTGHGIAAEDQDAVFEKFRQVGDTLTQKPSGTGLGLPICREIVAYLGGRIEVDSVVGQGSTFRFTLPVAVPSDSEP